MRDFPIALLFFVTGTVALSAQTRPCYEGDAIAARAFVEARAGEPLCDISCSGCGCKGGPGYRVVEGARPGACVSYKRLVSLCGPPPHTRCRRECYPVVAGCTQPSAAAVEAAGVAIRNRARKCVSGYFRPNGRCVAKRKLRQVCGEKPEVSCITAPKTD